MGWCLCDPAGSWGRSHSPRLSLDSCRYRCLVDLKHNLPASGDMCVSVLSRLCTVMPNMYRVGLSKVSATPHSAPRGSKFKGLWSLWSQKCLG